LGLGKIQFFSVVGVLSQRHQQQKGCKDSVLFNLFLFHYIAMLEASSLFVKTLDLKKSV
jgi:hypothetical protein